jgi:hypothetical protein
MSESKTIRQRIIEGITARLAGHAWQTAAFAVHQGKAAFDPDIDPAPLLTVLPRPDESSTTRYGSDENTMPVEVIAVLTVANPPTAPADLVAVTEPIKGEIQQVLTAEPDPTADPPPPEPLYERIEYRGGGLDEYPGEFGEVTIQIGLSLAVVYQTAAGDPYHQ